MRTAIYARLSLDAKGDGLGVDRQLTECRAYAAAQGWAVVAEYVDNDISATTGRRRPGFEALLAADGHDAVLVWHTDRLVRVGRDLERVIEKGWPVYALQAGHLDLATPAGRAVARTLTAWATYEGEQKAERQRAANRQRAAAGRPWWSSAPLGYTRDGEVESEGAAALAEAYERLLAGASLPTLATLLNDRGLRTTRGNPWTATSLRPVLLNARNAGLREYRGEVVGPGAWEGIVPEATWRRAVARLEAPSRRSGGGGPRRALLTGLARCGGCGGAVRVGWRGRKGAGVRVYACKGRHCVSFPADLADAVAEGRIVALLGRPDVLAVLAGPDDGEAAALLAEADDLRSELGALADLAAAGRLRVAQVAAMSAGLEARLADVERRLGTKKGPGPSAWEVAGAVDVGAAWAELSVDERRALIGMLAEVRLLPPGRGRRPGPEHVEMPPAGQPPAPR